MRINYDQVNGKDINTKKKHKEKEHNVKIECASKKKENEGINEGRQNERKLNEDEKNISE